MQQATNYEIVDSTRRKNLCYESTAEMHSFHKPQLVVCKNTQLVCLFFLLCWRVVLYKKFHHSIDTGWLDFMDLDEGDSIYLFHGYILHACKKIAL